MHSIHSRLDPSHRNSYAAFAAEEGMTQLLAVAKAVLEGEPNSRLQLFYGNRDISQVPRLEELQAFKDRFLSRLSLHFFFSDEPQDAELFNGRLDSPKIAELSASLFDARTVDDFYLCGPAELNRAATEALKNLGVEANHIHGDRGAEQPVSAAAAPASELAPVAAVDTDTARVTILIDGRRRHFSMPIGGQETVLEAAERCGLDLPFSCRAAVCSTCRTKVVKGSVDMAQNYALEQWEIDAGYILACQSRPTTRELELDYDDK